MGKKLVIVESPAKARTINKYLGKEYQVEASMGHVRDLPSSRFGVDFDNKFEPTYEIIERAKKTVAKLKKLALERDAVYLAPDPDREGEAISWHLKEILQEDNKNIYRVTFNEITKSAILEAFEHPRDIDMHLVDAQQARRILDRIVGYKISPLLWKKVAQGLSAGRVQTVALRLIIDREKEVNAFKPTEYWQIKAHLLSEKKANHDKVLVAKLDKIDGKKAEVHTGTSAEEIATDIKKQVFTVADISEKQKARKPQAPFTTSKLQQESYNRLRFSAQRTMRLAQKLYEGIDLGEEGSVGLITYMRTDSVNVSKGAQDGLRKYIKAKFGNDYLPAKPNVYKSKKSAQEAHEAIRPTDPAREPQAIKEYLTDEEFKLYDLIWRKFVASQMTPAIDNVTSIDIAAGPRYLLHAAGSRNLFKGFLACYEDPESSDANKGDDDLSEKKENQDLPQLEQNEILALDKLLHTQHFTKPPARYNDASIVKMLEELGIGRPSTYAPTIQTIITRNYVERKAGVLHPTEMGTIVTTLLIETFATIFDYQFTAQMEEELDKVEEGALKWKKVLEDFYVPFIKQLAEAESTMKNVKREAVKTDYKCDICGKIMLEKWGRFGKFLACSGFPQCRYTAPLPTGFRCLEPGCDGDLVKRQSKNRRIFYGCSKYPECKYVTNKLPKKNQDEETENDGIPANSQEL
jgi:DNA topoisomerase-1